MKKLSILLLSLIGCTTLIAQNPTTYFMEGSPLRSQWNPAFAPNRGYFNIPVAGGIQIGTTGNLSLDQLFYPDGNDNLKLLFDSSISPSTALSGLEPMNYLSLSTRVNLLGFGAYFKDKRSFWAFDLNLRGHIEGELPYELFDFMKRGNSTTISDMGASMEGLLEAAFTYSFPIKKKVYLGVRGKFLVGASRGEMRFERIDARMGEDRWYAHARGSLSLSGMIPSTRLSEEGTLIFDTDDMMGDFSIPAGYGFGFDVGVTYDPIPNLQLSASVSDLGVLFWSKKATSAGHINEEIEFTGVESDAAGNVIQPEFDLDELEFAVDPASGLSRMLRPTLAAGGEYNFLKRRIGLGLFYSARFGEYKTLHNVTFAANFRPLKWLHLSGSYSFIDNRGSAVGLALNICPKGINLFVGTDILLSKKSPQWLPISQSNMNITFGLAVPMGRTGQRHE